jgi:hypothetical protein
VHREIKKNLATANVSRAGGMVGQTDTGESSEFIVCRRGRRAQVSEVESRGAFFAHRQNAAGAI